MKFFVDLKESDWKYKCCLKEWDSVKKWDSVKRREE